MSRFQIPVDLWSPAVQRIPYLAHLPPSDLLRLHSLVLHFLNKKNFEGASGLKITDAIRTDIAVQACLLVLNLGIEYYRGWHSIIVYPGDFIVNRSVIDEIGVVHKWQEEVSGEAWERGPVILSWESCSQDSQDMNIVIHEFAHKLDNLEGPANGSPPLPPEIPLDAWSTEFSVSYARFRACLDSGMALPFDKYAAEDPAEFFAVMSESFFLQPAQVAKHFPSVYSLLSGFYRQDPLRVVATI